MKKKIIIVIIVLCVVMVGIIEWKSKKNYTADIDKVNKIIVAETMDSVKVMVSDDEQIHISYYEGISYEYDIAEVNSILTIKGNNNIPITLDFQNTSLIIEVPKDYGKDIEINTEKNCSLNDSIQFNDVDINSENNE